MSVQQEWVWQPWTPERQLTHPRGSPRRRWQWLTGGGSARWRQQVPGREWHSARCCPISCKKHKLRVGIKQCPSTQEQCDTETEASISRGLSGPLMATPDSNIWEYIYIYHWFHPIVFTQSKVFFLLCHPLPEVPGRKALCHSPPLACAPSHPRSLLHLKAMCPSALGQECHPFSKQQPLLTPSTPGQGHPVLSSSSSGNPRGISHKAAAGSDSSVTRHRALLQQLGGTESPWVMEPPAQRCPLQGPGASSALLTESSSLPWDWLFLALETLFVQWISQLMTVILACLAAWKLLNFSLFLPIPPRCSDHRLAPQEPQTTSDPTAPAPEPHWVTAAFPSAGDPENSTTWVQSTASQSCTAEVC